jgi:REP-associated tyrosine transposase
MAYRISIDTPALFITAVTSDRLPVFQTEALKRIMGDAINEARTSCGFLLFAYVFMPDHIHLLTDAPRKPSEVLQYIKGIIGHRVINHLKLSQHQSSLEKLRHVDWKRKHRYSLWQHDSDIFTVNSESKFMEKVNYIHMNPVRAGLVERPQDYTSSSARWWRGAPRDDEPLRVDLDKIIWRRSVRDRNSRK